LAIGEPKRTNQIKVLGDVTGRSTEKEQYLPGKHIVSIEEMRKILSVVAWIVAAMMAMPLIAAPALADGVSWKTTTNPEVWSHVQERSQFSIINFKDGYEKIIISIQVAESELQSGTRMFWLFPIPSAPQAARIDLISDVPRLEGVAYGNKVWGMVASDPMWYYCVLGSQIWAGVPAMLYFMVIPISGGLGGNDQLVDIYESTDKYGLHSEIISADNASDLQTYLASQGLIIPSGDQAIITDYIGSGFSFVSTRIDDLSDFRENATIQHDDAGEYYMMGVEADFPTDEIFFPLKLTSAYGDSDIPITVQVLGFVDISVMPATGSSLRITADYDEIDDWYTLRGESYYYGYHRSNESVNQTLAFFQEQIGADWQSHPTTNYGLWRDKFTVIQIDGKANTLISDLWMKDSPPSSVSTMEFFISNPWVIVLAIFLTISTIAGLIAGLFLDGSSKHIPQYLLIGLTNFLTIFVPTFLFSKYYVGWNKERYGEKPEKNALSIIRVNFFVAYTMTFTILSIGVWMIIARSAA
jgi:hypothetical protein